jgi:hypothetical protein
MKRVSRRATCFFRGKNNVYRSHDAHRTSGRRCSSTWKKCIGPAFASRLPMGCTTPEDGSFTSSEREKMFFHREKRIGRACASWPTMVCPTSEDPSCSSSDCKSRCFRAHALLCTTGRRNAPERSRRHADPRASVLEPSPRVPPTQGASLPRVRLALRSSWSGGRGDRRDRRNPESTMGDRRFAICHPRRTSRQPPSPVVDDTLQSWSGSPTRQPTEVATAREKSGSLLDSSPSTGPVPLAPRLSCP